MLNLIKKEVLQAGIRIGCTQAVRAVRGALSSVFGANERATSFLNSKVGSGILTTGVGLALGKATPNDMAQSIARECRILGAARAGNGLVEHVFTSSKPEPTDKQ